MDKIIFTKEGYARLHKQQEELLKKREEVLIRLTRAREMGDLSENSAYHGAKMELGDIDRRLRRLKINIRFGKIIETQHNGTVQLGSTVIVNNGHEDMELKIVGEFESNPLQGQISHHSPLGSSLLGKKAGDQIKIHINENIIVYQVKEIK